MLFDKRKLYQNLVKVLIILILGSNSLVVFATDMSGSSEFNEPENISTNDLLSSSSILGNEDTMPLETTEISSESTFSEESLIPEASSTEEINNTDMIEEVISAEEVPYDPYFPLEPNEDDLRGDKVKPGEIAIPDELSVIYNRHISMNQEIINNVTKGVFKRATIKQDWRTYSMFPYQTLNGSTQNKPHGIVIHETANPNSTIDNEIAYMDRNWRSAFVHAFVDQSKIIEIHDPSYGAWGAGREANKYFMHIELVEHPNDRTAFMKSVLNDAYYAATKLYQFGLTPSRPSKKKGDISGTIWSHNEVSAYLGGTDHTDPTGYFSKFGYSMEQFYELIQYEFEGLGVMTSSDEFVKENGWNLLKSGQWIFIENNKLVEGWKKIDGLYYYFDATGIMQKDWHKEGSYKYYLSSKGSMVTGWSLIKDYWYYFNQSGEMQQGWSKQNNIWYYLLPGGEMAKEWQLIENHWYYFNQSGEMQQGWSKQNNIWYYLLSNGKMATSWQLIGSHWYYFSQLGEMQQGWNKQNNIWYYLLPDGRMATEWHLIGNKWYYLSAGGAMATSWQLIDNTWYYFDVLGYIVKRLG